MSRPPQTSHHYTISSGSLEDLDLVTRWERLCSRSQQQTPFSTPLYATGLGTHLGFESTIYLVTENGDDTCGVLLYSRKRGPFTLAEVPPFTSFVSLVLASSETISTASDALAPYRVLLKRIEDEFASIRLHHHPSLTDVRLFNWAGWTTSPLYTYYIGLQEQEDVTERWSNSTKRNFKKNAPLYQFEENPSHLYRVIELAQGSYHRHQRSLPAPADEIYKFASYLQKAGMVRVFTLIPSGEKNPEAAIALLHHDGVAYYWLAGSIPGDSMTVLLGNLLPVLKEEGIHTFDFVGANTRRIAEFKRRFGSTLVPYYSSTITRNRLLAALRFGKNAVARLKGS